MNISKFLLPILIVVAIEKGSISYAFEHVIQVLKEYPGSMIIVSHEEDFLEAIDIDHICTITDGRL